MSRIKGPPRHLTKRIILMFMSGMTGWPPSRPNSPADRWRPPQFEGSGPGPSYPAVILPAQGAAVASESLNRPAPYRRTPLCPTRRGAAGGMTTAPAVSSPPMRRPLRWSFDGLCLMSLLACLGPVRAAPRRRRPRLRAAPAHRRIQRRPVRGAAGRQGVARGPVHPGDLRGPIPPGTTPHEMPAIRDYWFEAMATPVASPRPAVRRRAPAAAPPVARPPRPPPHRPQPPPSPRPVPPLRLRPDGQRLGRVRRVRHGGRGGREGDGVRRLLRWAFNLAGWRRRYCSWGCAPCG